MSVAATILVVFVAALWGLAIYKRLVRHRTAVRKAWSRLESARARRRELSAALVNVLTGAPATDREVIDAVTSAGNQAAASRGPAAAATREEALTAALTALLAHVDCAPASPQLLELRPALVAAESALADARSTYNDTAASYNRSIAAVPDNLVAGLAGFSKAERFESRDK